MTTKKQMRERLDAVESAIERRGWSGKVCRDLASLYGVGEETVKAWRRQVLDEIAEGYRSIDRELTRGEFLIRVREHAQAAREAESFGPVASLLSIEGRVLGVYQDAATLTHQADEPASLDDVIQRLQELPEPVRRKLADTLTGGG